MASAAPYTIAAREYMYGTPASDPAHYVRPENQQSSTLHRDHDGGHYMEYSLDQSRRNLHRRDRRTIPERLSTHTVTAALSKALEDVPSKVLAREAGSSQRAAENVKQGLNSMSLAYFFNAARGIPELRELGMRLMGCPDVSSADVMRAIDLLMGSKREVGE